MGRRFPAWLLIAVAIAFLLPSLDADARRKKRRRRRARFGKLLIKSNTKGAQVFVDGRLVGTVPLAKPLRVKVGRHTIKLIKPGYTQYLDVVSVPRRGKASIDIDLLPVMGILKVRCNEREARVFIDGKFVGMAPLEQEVGAGKHAIRVKKEGFHDFISSVSTIAGEKQSVMAHLEQMAVGTTPYRPAPPPPPKWFEKWYVWAGIAGALVVTAVAIVVPVVATSGNPIDDFGPEKRFQTQ
jgi:hypothetical protein